MNTYLFIVKTISPNFLKPFLLTLASNWIIFEEASLSTICSPVKLYPASFINRNRFTVFRDPTVIFYNIKVTLMHSIALGIIIVTKRSLANKESRMMLPSNKESFLSIVAKKMELIVTFIFFFHLFLYQFAVFICAIFNFEASNFKFSSRFLFELNSFYLYNCIVLECIYFLGMFNRFRIKWRHINQIKKCFYYWDYNAIWKFI